MARSAQIGTGKIPKICTEKKMWFFLNFQKKGKLLPFNTAVTGDLYRRQLDTVAAKLTRKMDRDLFLHDHARPHVAKLTCQRIQDLGWTKLPPPTVFYGHGPNWLPPIPISEPLPRWTAVQRWRWSQNRPPDFLRPEIPRLPWAKYLLSSWALAVHCRSRWCILWWLKLHVSKIKINWIFLTRCPRTSRPT